MDESTTEKPTVVIIDDEKVILDLTSIILRNRGYRVVTASDPVVGLERVRELSPEIVLLDYMMPMMDGLTVLKCIRESHPDSYVLMFTGKGSEEIAVELMKAGAYDYIIKPFNNQDLADRIERVLKIRSVEMRNRELLEERERLIAEIEAWNQELERRVQEKTEELQRVQGEIVQTEKLATLGYLSAGMAHEIRNPLNSISLFSQLLRSSTDDAEKQECIDKILVEIDRIDAILRKLLEASKRPRYEISEVRVDDVARRVLDSFTAQISLNRIQVSLSIPSPPPPIQADPSEIEQIFTNLFLNAIHEMEGGGVLTLSITSDDRAISVRVGDTGKGIPPEHLPNIFDPFFTTKSRGSGLGLSVVLRIVKTYQGRIKVEKSGPTGTVFLVTLPVTSGGGNG
ncbi:MAG: response regulator [Desulfuromonadia bacterium]